MRTSSRSARGHRAGRIVAAALASASLLLTSACLEEDTSGSPATTSVIAAPQGGAGGEQGGAGGEQGVRGAVVRTVGKTGWFEGFEITVDKATVTPDEYGGGKVVIDITYKNTTAQNLTLSNNSHLETGKEVDGGASFDNPAVPGKGSATGRVTTPVQKLKDADHLLDTITVVYGESTDNQTKIPLANSGKVESVQPKTLPITGTLVQDQTTVQVTAATLNPSYTKNERGKDELSLRVKFVGGAGIPAGGTNIYYQYFSLRTPDGQTLVADFRGTINELLSRNQTIDKPDNYVVFVVPSPAAGTYVLSYDNSNGVTTAPTFTFTVQ
ncbi:hypothetical protein [Nocardia bovistercoris]|uniref:DUF4352 domain-containing protein n=1 Tax=Nocardia bovistercoris TaxID=2785916 RepID=A0A931IBQ9_9NOCA|nr:hypothetical protein [Nocardia bovistercoris]MBH0777257.1 hypothetical protein [Nocardia bovistercoris]